MLLVHKIYKLNSCWYLGKEHDGHSVTMDATNRNLHVGCGMVPYDLEWPWH